LFFLSIEIEEETHEDEDPGRHSQVKKYDIKSIIIVIIINDN